MTLTTSLIRLLSHLSRRRHWQLAGLLVLMLVGALAEMATLSSSIMGGAAGVNLLLGMIRTKFAAVLIGTTTGVGLLASFTAIQGIVGTLAGLGIQSSALREIAAAVGQGDEQAIGRVVLTPRSI